MDRPIPDNLLIHPPAEASVSVPVAPPPPPAQVIHRPGGYKRYAVPPPPQPPGPSYVSTVGPADRRRALPRPGIFGSSFYIWQKPNLPT